MYYFVLYGQWVMANNCKSIKLDKMTIELKSQAKRIRIQPKTKHPQEKNQSFPIIQSNNDKEFSPWNFDYDSKEIYRPLSRSMNVREKESLPNRLTISHTPKQSQTKYNNELMDIIRRQKFKHKRPIISPTPTPTKLNQISLQLDEQLLYSPEKLYGLPQTVQENRSGRSGGGKRDEPMRVKIFKRISQKRQRENQTRQMRENQYFRDNKLTNRKGKKINQNYNQNFYKNQKQDKQISDYRPYQTISLELDRDVKAKEKEYFHLTVRKLKAKECALLKGDKGGTPKQHQYQHQHQNQHQHNTIKQKEFSLLQCKGEICLGMDKHEIRKHKLKKYAIDNRQPNDQTLFLQ